MDMETRQYWASRRGSVKRGVMNPSLPLSGHYKLKESDRPNSNFFEPHDSSEIPSGLLGMEGRAQAMGSYSGYGFSMKRRSRVVNGPWALTPSLITLKREYLLAPTVSIHMPSIYARKGWMF